MTKGLKQCRIDAGFTQEQVSNALNISQETISQYETGARKISLYTAKRLADLYSVSIDDFFNLKTCV